MDGPILLINNMHIRPLTLLLSAFAVFAAGAGDIGRNPWPSTVQGSMLIDALTPIEVTKDLAGHWRFDEGSGSVAVDSSGEDWSGSIAGAAWVSTSPTPGYALEFDGSGDYVNAGDVPFENRAFTFTIRISSDSIIDGRPFAGRYSHNTPAPTYRGWFIYAESDGTVVVFVRSSVDGYGYYYGEAGCVSATIKRVTMVYPDNDTYPRIYCDDVQQTVTRGTFGSGEPNHLEGIYDPGNPFAIGYSMITNFNTWRTFNGILDDPRVYYRALTSAEIAAIVEKDW